MRVSIQQAKALVSSLASLVDKKRGALNRHFLKVLLDAASVPEANDLPWPALRKFVKDVSELDTEQSTQGLKFFRQVFGLDHTFLVVDIGSAFVTNNNKTGVNDPKAETKKVMKALPDIWRWRATCRRTMRPCCQSSGRAATRLRLTRRLSRPPRLPRLPRMLPLLRR